MSALGVRDWELARTRSVANRANIFSLTASN
jgi:hypothetical protein